MKRCRFISNQYENDRKTVSDAKSEIFSLGVFYQELLEEGTNVLCPQKFKYCGTVPIKQGTSNENIKKH